MAARLKVFRTKAGFYETVVAAPNQGAALAAWGVRQNLFAEGAADVVEDAAIVKAALAAPGQPLRRPIGSDAAFTLDPDSLPTVPDAPKREADAGAPSKARPAKAKPPPKPDRKALIAAEKALEAVDAQHEAARAAFEQRSAALEQERTEAEARWRDERKVAAKALQSAERDFRRAGGEL